MTCGSALNAGLAWVGAKAGMRSASGTRDLKYLAKRSVSGLQLLIWSTLYPCM
ncbi:hypothetical protein CM49_06361 [Paenibacillus sp. P1XP2]|nr:hypothetical protein CM49_06361 [Paenibacillus sp. P1XP2]